MDIRRDDWIRTSGLFVPNEARYRAALHPESCKGTLCRLSSKYFTQLWMEQNFFKRPYQVKRIQLIITIVRATFSKPHIEQVADPHAGFYQAH
jgi:hypothetical protein